MGIPEAVDAVVPSPAGPAPAEDELLAQRRQVWLLTAGAVALLLGAVIWFQWLQQRQEIGAASALGERRAANLAAELTRTLQSANVAIAQWEDKLQRVPAGTSLSQALHELALGQASLLATLPVPIQLHAVDARGRSIELAPGSAPASGADRGYTNLADLPASGSWRASPTQGAEGSRVLPLLRRAPPNAHGIVAYAVELDHQALVARLERSRLPQGGGAAVFLAEPDGSVLVLARAPYVNAELGRRLRGPVAQALTSQPRGVVDTVTQIDQVRRVVAYQRLPVDSANLLVTYGMETRGVLADWTSQLPLVAGVTLLLVVGLLWGGWRLDRSLQAGARGRQALLRSENHFRALTGNLPDVVTRFDALGRHLYANPSIEIATGLPAHAVIGKTNDELGMPTNIAVQWTAALNRVFASGRPERLEFDFPGPQGLRHWESLLALEPPLPGEGPTVLVISRDVSERRKREAESQRLHATLDALVQGSTDAIFVKDRDGRYIVANQAIAALMGRPVQDLLGADDDALFGTKAAAVFRADDRRVILSRTTETYEESVPSPQGPRSYLTTKGPLILDGEVCGVFGIARDITERQQAVTALRESEERLRLALAAAHQGLYDLDLRTGQAVVSPEYARMLGYEPDELQETNQAWRERLHPDDRKRAVQAFEDYLAGRAPEYRVEFRQRTRQGGWKWILSLGSVQARDDAGQALRMLGTHTDVTAEREAQAALRHSELRFRLAASYGQVWEWDFGSSGLLPSPEFFQNLGYEAPPPGEVAARFSALIPPEDDARMRQLLSRHFKGKSDYHLEFRARDSQGRTRWFETQGKALINDQGRATYMAGTTFEITERRQAEDAVRQLAAELEQRVSERTAELARSESRFRAIFETVPVSIGEEDWSGVQRLLRGLRERGVTDSPAYFAQHPEFVRECLSAVRIVRLNRKAQDLNGLTGHPPETIDLRTFYPSDQLLPEFVGEVEALWEGQRLYTAKKSLPSIHGEQLNLMMTMSLPALEDADGTALVCLVDITEIDRLNAELDQTVARLRQMNRELETFTYSVSHDLKAPLRGIDGYSRLLLSEHGQALDEEGRQFLGHIRQATQHMGVLIDDLLAYSRLERRELTMSAVLLAPVVESVLRPYRQPYAEPGLQLVVEVPPHLQARADTQGLLIALRNLVDNAVKFSRQTASPRVRIMARQVAGAVQLVVEDNGLGFDMKFHDRIFSIFQRLHRAEQYPGTGVGLAMVSKAMERMGGRVWAHSELGQGATFTLELPEAP